MDIKTRRSFMGTRQGYREWFDLWERRDDNVTMTNVFQFGEEHPDYPVRVLNEREARGAAGIMFMVATVFSWLGFLLAYH